MLRTQEDREGTGNSARQGDGSSHGEFESFSAYFTDMADQVAHLGRIQVARGRLRARRAGFLAITGIVVAVVAAAIALSGVRLFVDGLTLGLSELVEGRLWMGQLFTGLLLLALTALALVTIRSWSERQVLRDLQKRKTKDRKTVQERSRVARQREQA